MHSEIINMYKAVHSAIIAEGGKSREWEYRVLLALYGADKRLSFFEIYRQYTRGCPSYNLGYGRYYDAIEKLLKRKLIDEIVNARGKRRWSLTPAGRIEIERLNRRAMEYLKMQDQGGE